VPLLAIGDAGYINGGMVPLCASLKQSRKRYYFCFIVFNVQSTVQKDELQRSFAIIAGSTGNDSKRTAAIDVSPENPRAYREMFWGKHS